MVMDDVLARIRDKLFYGSVEYTKNQPDLFLPHRFKILAPSQVAGFLGRVREGLADEKEVLLYVHLPFCFSECSFCNSFPQKTNKGAQQEYLKHLLREIDLFSSHGVLEGKAVRAVYFGGGTPTSFDNDALRLILERLAANADFSGCTSITSEAHPLTLADGSRVAGLRDMGITRLSVGCQTFDQQILRLCNRSNTEEQIAKVVGAVQDAGLAINIDMMTGLPGQTLDSVRRDLDILGTVRPTSVEYIRHEIVNPLVVKLYQEHPELVVGNDTLFEMVYVTQNWMSENGYEQNGRYTGDAQWGYRYHWLQEMPILAFGARARSYTKTLCYDKYEEVESYSNILRNGALPVGRYVELTQKEQMYRSLLLSLQLRSGLDRARFRQRFGTEPQELFAELLTRLDDYGCLVQEDASIRLSKYGAYFVEDVCDAIIDAVMKEQSRGLARTPHSEGGTSARLR